MAIRHRLLWFGAIPALAGSLAVGVLWAAIQDAGSPGKDKKASSRLPDDPKLLELHKEFVTKAEKLAREYERENDTEKARVCYEEILRLVPGYPKAEAALNKIREEEASASRRAFDVFANRDWQDTGVDLIEGKPVAIRASGSWIFKMSHELGPEGIPIPEELRAFNLGCLVGMVVEGDRPRRPRS